MQDKSGPSIRETLQIRKIDKSNETDPEFLCGVTVSDKLYTEDRKLISSSTFEVPGWIGEWSLHNANLRATNDGVVYPFGSENRKKVAIVGCQREYIPESVMNSNEWEVWACNSLWNTARDARGRFRADRWFEMHPIDVQTDTELQRMKECPVPLYVLDGNRASMFTSGIVYPLDKVLKLWPFGYFTCTFAYQVALALTEGFTDIGIFGTELSYGNARERTFERACLEFWLGMAFGAKRTVHFPKNSRLCRHPYRYGYDYAEEKVYCERKGSVVAVMSIVEPGSGGDIDIEKHINTFQQETALEQEEYNAGKN